jgi:predicted Zn-dependent protease
MKSDFRVCPECGTRNKPKWEFCARCGDSLQGVPLGEPASEEAVEFEYDETISPGAFPWVTGLGLLAFGALAVAVIARSEKQSPDQRPNPNIFTLPTLPASPAAARPQAKDTGKDGFDDGMRRLLAGDAAGAVAPLAQAVAAEPDNPLYRNTYAKALLAAGSSDEALRQFEAALRLSPDNVSYLSDAARTMDRAGKLAEAARAYETILLRQPRNEQALGDLASLHQRNGHPEQALPLLRQLAEGRPDDLVVRQELAHVLENTGDLRGARHEYEKVLAEKPEAHVTRGLLAELHFKQGEKDEAIALLRDGVARDAGAPLLHRGLGSLLERSGDVAEAAKEYREYSRLAPNAPDARQLADRADRLERRQAAASPSPSGT